MQQNFIEYYVIKLHVLAYLLLGVIWHVQQKLVSVMSSRCLDLAIYTDLLALQLEGEETLKYRLRLSFVSVESWYLD